MIGRVSPPAVHAAIRPTLRALYDEPSRDWSRLMLACLAAVLDHVERRADRDPTTSQQLAEALDTLAGNPLVPSSGSSWDRAARALAAAVERDGSAEAVAVQARLRPILVTELDSELAQSSPMLTAFRGRWPDA